MTTSEQLAVAGRRVDLAVRGRSVTLQPGGSVLVGYVGEIPKETGVGQPTPEVAQSAMLSFLKEDLTALNVGIGSNFTGADGARYRVIECPKDQSSVMARFHCEVA